MQWFDMKNILTLLRAKVAGAAPEETMAGMLSGGTLDEARLNQAVIDAAYRSGGRGGDPIDL